MTTAEQVKQIDLLDYIQKGHVASKVGPNTFRVNPCPVCGGRDHFTIYTETNSFSSFSGCCKGGSIIDYVLEVEGAANVTEAIELLSGEKKTKRKASPVAAEKAQKYDFSNFIDNLKHYDPYYSNRGISEETASKYNLSFESVGLKPLCETFKINPPAMAPAYRFILPLYNKEEKCTHFIARLDESIYPVTDNTPKTRNYGGSDAPYFNEKYLYDEKLSGEYIFITEGIFDALSIEEIGYQAISLNSAVNYSKIVDLLKQNEEMLKDKTFLVAGDNDEAGQKLIANLVMAFKDSKLTVEAFHVPSEYKDINDFLKANRSEFESYTSGIINGFALKDTAFEELASLYSDLLNQNFQKPIQTCFSKLNKKLGGGIYPGFYVIGAISSLGKTTMIQQIADGLAAAGEHVIFYSLEMGKRELISKSLSREMSIVGERISTRSLMNGDIKNKELFAKAVGVYEKYAKNVFIYEGNFDTTVDEIRRTAEKHINRFGKKPIIIVDYLQILTPVEQRMTDKQANDRNVTSLKRMSRDLNTTVIAISSFNRENYNSTVSFSSFKESGAIEYTADCVIGLELSAIRELPQGKNDENERRNLINRAKEEIPRKIRLVILKNRNGSSYAELNYDYQPPINTFIER